MCFKAKTPFVVFPTDTVFNLFSCEIQFFLARNQVKKALKPPILRYFFEKAENFWQKLCKVQCPVYFCAFL